jgi:hypothetical protein
MIDERHSALRNYILDALENLFLYKNSFNRTYTSSKIQIDIDRFLAIFKIVSPGIYRYQCVVKNYLFVIAVHQDKEGNIIG